MNVLGWGNSLLGRLHRLVDRLGLSFFGIYVLVALERSLLVVVYTLVARMEVLGCGMFVLMVLV